MKNVFKKIFVLLITLTAVVSLASCNETPKEKLYVATSTDYAPYEFIDLTKTGQEQYVGADIALARFLADELNMELVVKPMAFDTILAAIDSGKANLAISGITSTPGRRATYAFSTGYYDEGEGAQTLVIKKTDVTKYTKLEDFNQENVKVAVQAGTYQDELVTAQLPSANVTKIADLSDALSLLESGTYDAVAMASNPANAMIANKATLQIAPCQFVAEDSAFYAVAQKANTELMEKVNAAIAKVNEQGLYAKWISEAEALLDTLGGNAGELIPE